jgi:hypothetical protein
MGSRVGRVVSSRKSPHRSSGRGSRKKLFPIVDERCRTSGLIHDGAISMMKKVSQAMMRADAESHGFVIFAVDLSR